MAILFDLDGVLIDSLEVHRRVWHRWALGHGLDPVQVFEATFGCRPVDTIRAVADNLVPDDEISHLDALLDAEADAVRLQPGALAAVQCASLGRWAIVTSTEQGRARGYLTHLGCAVPEVVIGGTDVQNGKPAPDGYLAAAQRLGVAPTACLVVEDAPAGVAAAKQAGAAVLAVASTRPSTELVDADVLVDDLTAATRLVRAWAQDPPHDQRERERLLSAVAG